jgi:hypothetical protein
MVNRVMLMYPVFSSTMYGDRTDCVSISSRVIVKVMRSLVVGR